MSSHDQEIKRGTHLHCRLYGGRNAYVLSVEPGGTREVGGARVTSNAQVRIVYAEPSALSSVPLSIVQGPQWLVGGQPRRREDDLQQLIKTATENAAAEKELRDKKERLEKAQQQAGEAIMTLLDERLNFQPKSVLIAYFDRDKSDSQSDYHGSERGETWAIGFSKHNKNLFPEMRKTASDAALHISNDEQVADLKAAMSRLAENNPEFENRENYSMGGGMFLSDKPRGSCWKVEKWLRDAYQTSKICDVIGKGMLLVERSSDALGSDIVDIYERHGLYNEAHLFCVANDFIPKPMPDLVHVLLARDNSPKNERPEEEGDDADVNSSMSM